MESGIDIIQIDRGRTVGNAADVAWRRFDSQ